MVKSGSRGQVHCVVLGVIKKQEFVNNQYCACVVYRGHLFHPTSIFPLRCIKSGLNPCEFFVKIGTAHAYCSGDTWFKPHVCSPLRYTKSRLDKSKFQSKVVLRMRSTPRHLVHPTWPCQTPTMTIERCVLTSRNLVNLGPLCLLQWTLVHLRHHYERGPRYGVFTKMKNKNEK